jgi:hypothetical protein
MSMTDIINETLCLFRPLTEYRSLTVDLALGNGLLIWSSGRPLRVVVRNLVHNACKFVEAGGCVRIHTQLGEKGQILFSVLMTENRYPLQSSMLELPRSVSTLPNWNIAAVRIQGWA